MKTKTTQTFGEEIANSVSHGLGLLGALAITPVLIVASVQHGGAADIVAASIFSATLIILYLCSTLYHALPGSKAKRIFQTLDHVAIFLLIAGTYTPFTLGVLRGGWGWTLFGLVWGLAIVGILLKVIGSVRSQILPTCLYLAMGWLVLIALEPLWINLPSWGLFWLVAGGLAYTIGVGFFAAQRVPYSHFIWHLLVLAGTTCHVIAVLGYAIPLTARPV